jgi:methionyl-tRNA formyltransferase
MVVTLDQSLSAAKSRYAAVDDITNSNSILLLEIKDITDPAVVSAIRDAAPDVIFEIGWSQMIGREVLDMAPKGCIGIHDSLLPKAQGAASLNWALIWGEPSWGISLFYLEERFDKGEIIAQRAYEIDDDDDINTLFDKADIHAVDLLREMVPRIRDGTAPKIAQDPALVTTTERRRPEDSLIDWSRNNRDVHNLVRALKKPYPPAFTYYRGEKVLILDSKTDDTSTQGVGVFSAVTPDGLVVGTGEKSLLVRLLEMEGGPELDASRFCESYGLTAGDTFGE